VLRELPLGMKLEFAVWTVVAALVQWWAHIIKHT
jgi:hypothetical protein